VIGVAISLQKGQRVDLTKGNPGLSKIMVGLGWDPVSNKGAKGGLFGSLFGGGSSNINVDCDASVILLDEHDKLKSNHDVIYFGNLKSMDGSIQHSGDNLTGDGAGDDEQVHVDLSRIPASIHKLVFAVNIYDCVKRKQHFGMLKNAFIRIVDPASRQELIHYNLAEDYSGSTSLIVGEIYRNGSDWKFGAVGIGTSAPSLSELVRSYT
jgi:stress response protein SCP2